MSKSSRLLFAAAALLLGAVFIWPLWTVNLIAPQYPEGLGMEIHVNSVHGVKPADLDNINELNHYIGMKRIEPESIPELTLMPRVLLGLIAFGLLVAAVGKRALAWTWVGAFAVLAVVGLVDFYRWEYDYGHNLDYEHAIIKIPGMSYQPPLIGSKQLLNFTASSWPAPGAYVLGASVALALVALLVMRRKQAAVPAAEATAVPEPASPAPAMSPARR